MRAWGVVLSLALLAGCGGNTLPKRAAADDLAKLNESGALRQLAAPADGDPIAIITTSMGEIRAVLYPDAAPMAVYNFVGLARTGYYTGTEFWRTEYGFAVQGGDATGSGTSGSTIWSNNPYPLESTTALRHYAGALCAAFGEGGEKTGGNSQFYVVTALPDSVDKALQSQLAENGYSEEEIAAYAEIGGLPYLDNTDTVFGQVYAGLEIADQIAAAETAKAEDGSDTHRPATPITIEDITIAAYPGPTAEEMAAVAQGAGD